MKIISRKISFQEYDSLNELPDKQRDLVKAAMEACKGSYSVYSRFKVGAAVLLDNGEVITGNNQENIAYPSGLCAERVALFYAQSMYPNSSIQMIAIAASSESDKLNEPVMPCGACRQVMAEYEDRHNVKLKTIMASETGKVFITDNMEALLPMRFRADFLKG